MLRMPWVYFEEVNGTQQIIVVILAVPQRFHLPRESGKVNDLKYRDSKRIYAAAQSSTCRKVFPTHDFQCGP